MTKHKQNGEILFPQNFNCIEWYKYKIRRWSLDRSKKIKRKKKKKKKKRKKKIQMWLCKIIIQYKTGQRTITLHKPKEWNVGPGMSMLGVFCSWKHVTVLVCSWKHNYTSSKIIGFDYSKLKTHNKNYIFHNNTSFNQNHQLHDCITSLLWISIWPNTSNHSVEFLKAMYV